MPRASRYCCPTSERRTGEFEIGQFNAEPGRALRQGRLLSNPFPEAGFLVKAVEFETAEIEA